MSLSIPRSLVEYILLGPTGDRRQLQDSPILGDVWIAYANEPLGPQELLITPYKTETAGHVATELDDRIYRDRDRKRKVPKKRSRTSAKPRSPLEPAHFAYLQGIIAARLYFEELLRVVVPVTGWWASSRNRNDFREYLDETKGAERLGKVLDVVQAMAKRWAAPAQGGATESGSEVLLSALDRYAALAGIILWAQDPKTIVKEAETATKESDVDAAIANAIANGRQKIAQGLKSLFNEILEEPQSPADPGKEPDKREGSLVYQVSLNRRASMALTRSVSAIKADAATRLFNVDCSEITWAIVDSGVQGNHPAFNGKDGQSRVAASFDFTKYRAIVSLDNLRIFQGDDEQQKEAALGELLHDNLTNKPTKEVAIGYLLNLANDVKLKRPVHWEFVEPFVRIKVATRPRISDHGTHVAGIIGAREQPGASPGDEAAEFVNGVCPDIQLYDFRVIAATSTVKDTEFAIIAVLQYIRHINDRHDFITIHGTNLSLSIPHDVRNYACGRTPICVEAERLVDSGVVVVAAAGNFGYQSFTTKEGSFESYAAFSITDPGNADGVITVGSTHRYSPHTYGVSFFSSRGPTGDGRLKPDLVAPGERIHAPFREGWGDLDGTSMAAPHVSGAAAMLMARYSELIGQPRRIKRILCESATDLGRERSFQGNGMLDVLRAFQSI